MVRERRARRTKPEPKHRANSGSIWDTPRIKKMAAEPFGSPIELTRDEAIALARDAFGRGKGRFPSGVDYVKQVRHIWKGLIKPRHG